MMKRQQPGICSMSQQGEDSSSAASLCQCAHLLLALFEPLATYAAYVAMHGAAAAAAVP
jgi:hypothetical protein